MGFAQSVTGPLGQASQYDAMKRQTLIRGEAKKQQAYAAATAKEEAAKQQLHVVGENMARTAGNKRRDVGKARAAAASNGFVQEGSNTKVEEMVQQAYSQQMADMARSGSQASMNALNEQIALRRGGDAALTAAQAEAEQYRALAKASRTAAWMNAAGGIIGAAGGAVKAGAAMDGPMSAWGQDEWGKVIGGGIYGADAGSGLMTAFNPFTAQYASETWDRNFMDLMGIGNLKKR